MTNGWVRDWTKLGQLSVNITKTCKSRTPASELDPVPSRRPQWTSVTRCRPVSPCLPLRGSGSHGAGDIIRHLVGIGRHWVRFIHWGRLDGTGSAGSRITTIILFLARPPPLFPYIALNFIIEQIQFIYYSAVSAK